jgi:hypothetical protein
MGRLWAGLLLVSLFPIGFWRIRAGIGGVTKRFEFAAEFQKQLYRYLESKGQSNDAYSWLILRSQKMQSEMGGAGILAALSLPFGRGTIPNYPIILNAIPELPQMFAGPFGHNPGYAKMINEAILRYLGMLQDEQEEAQRDLKNPVKWLLEGIQFVAAIPILILKSCGLDSVPGLGWLINSWFSKFVSGLVALITLIASVVTIVAGWDQTNSFLQKLIHYFR